MIGTWEIGVKLNIGQISLFLILNLRLKLDLKRMVCFRFMTPWR